MYKQKVWTSGHNGFQREVMVDAGDGGDGGGGGGGGCDWW